MGHARLRARIDPARRRYLRRNLRRWFSEHGRDLPWRRTRDPYAILVAEIMLQQTQVPRVAEVYSDFLERFPAIEDVAAAPLRDVKWITDPLGYKIRGQWIKQIADHAVTYNAGRLPATTSELMELPGVGRYTAGAVMTFAYDVPTPILDTNVARVLGRWFHGALPAEDTAGLRLRRLWALAEAVLPRRDGWTINQALMDLGAQLCVARNPRCLECPMQRRCHFAGPDRAAGEAHIVQWLPPGSG